MLKTIVDLKNLCYANDGKVRAFWVSTHLQQGTQKKKKGFSRLCLLSGI